MIEAPPEQLEYYQETLLRRLARLVTLKEGLVAPRLLTRARFWAYADCVTAGIGAKATTMLNMALGETAARQQYRIVGPPPAPVIDPNRCIKCGHTGTAHILATIGERGYCAVCGKSSPHDFDGGYTETLRPVPQGDPCVCGHSEAHHATFGDRVCYYGECACANFQVPDIGENY